MALARYLASQYCSQHLADSRMWPSASTAPGYFSLWIFSSVCAICLASNQFEFSNRATTRSFLPKNSCEVSGGRGRERFMQTGSTTCTGQGRRTDEPLCAALQENPRSKFLYSGFQHLPNASQNLPE